MSNWIKVTEVESCPIGSGVCSLVNDKQIAIFHYAEDEWYGLQNLCPHKKQMIMSRGLIGDLNGEPKVSCPSHKNAFSLKTGKHLGDGEDWVLETYTIKIDSGFIFVDV